MLYHFVLTYSNWEDVTPCYSESFESLSDGLQNAVWELGGVPLQHQTDRLTTAVNNNCDEKEFQSRYQALMRHYRLEPVKIQAGKRIRQWKRLHGTADCVNSLSGNFRREAHHGPGLAFVMDLSAKTQPRNATDGQ